MNEPSGISRRTLLRRAGGAGTQLSGGTRGILGDPTAGGSLDAPEDGRLEARDGNGDGENRLPGMVDAPGGVST